MVCRTILDRTPRLANQNDATGCQNLKYTLMSLESYDIINTGSLPLGKGVTLRWIGITAEGVSDIRFVNR